MLRRALPTASILALGLFLCLSVPACKGGGEEFRKVLRGAAHSVDKGGVKEDGKKGKKQKDRLALENKNSIKSCPEHSRLRGAPYPEGSTQWCEAMSKDGKAVRHGEYRRWNKKGNLKIQANYDKGKYSGEVRLWHIDGTLKELTHYKEGLKHGPSTQWNRDGTKKETGYYLGGQKHGSFARWSRGGQLKEKGDYVQDQLSGTWVSYHRDGQAKEISNWSLGKKHGKSETYSKDGFLMSRELFKEDLPEGKWETYYRNGRKKSVGTYLGGQKHGYWLIYDRNGSLRKTISYNKGAIVKNSSSHYASTSGYSSRKRFRSFGSGDILGAPPPLRRRTPPPSTAPTKTNRIPEKGLETGSAWKPL